MPRNFEGMSGVLCLRKQASMRPRQMPRNFPRAPSRSAFANLSFNEAAADAAEFSRSAARRAWWCRGFNEAAADAAEF